MLYNYSFSDVKPEFSFVVLRVVVFSENIIYSIRSIISIK